MAEIIFGMVEIIFGMVGTKGVSFLGEIVLLEWLEQKTYRS